MGENVTLTGKTHFMVTCKLQKISEQALPAPCEMSTHKPINVHAIFNTSKDFTQHSFAFM